MSSPTYKNTNEMPIKQATMKIDKTKVKRSSNVSSKVKILNIELQAMKKELQDLEGLRNENQAMKKELQVLKKELQVLATKAKKLKKFF